MGAKGINLAEEGHIVNIIPPVDINGGVTNSDVFSLKNYAHATIILQLGVTGAACTPTVEECDDFVPTNVTTIAHARYDEETAAGDTLSARSVKAAAGVATSTNNNIMYVFEIDADELTDGRPNLRLVLSDPGVATFASAVAILTGGIAKGITPTAIA